MEKLTSKQIRQMWLDFFFQKGHEILPSKSLIPINDPSLLWINSGVATLKPYFTGQKIPSNPRLTNSQKSIRTNDIENVGTTARHHTLFEMLGNFSIGDYFKKEALTWAYELLFNVFKFEKKNIYITYFVDDQETYNYWLSLGIDSQHLIKGDRDRNFWDMGEGPCGPCSEIFYDRGEKYDPKKIGVRLLEEDLENDRYVEIWNIVFSQFNNDGSNNYKELKQKNIDTGAGLERIVSIFQDAPTNFDTDLFLPIIAVVEKLTNSKYDINNYFNQEPKQANLNKHFRVIADHLRAATLAIEDGAKPSNTQRGYIIRRLIRRAYRSGLLLGAKETTFLHKIVPVVAEVMSIFPIDVESVSKVIQNEELQFAKTITQGQEMLERALQNGMKQFDAEVAFKLFETYGFPIELVQEILAERGISLDLSQFEDFKAKHAEISRSKKAAGMSHQIQIIQEIKSQVSTFVGYDDSQLTIKTKIIFQGMENGKNYLLLEKTPFYATGGGQSHDLGTINGFDVLEVFKDKYGNHWHILEHVINAVTVEASVDNTLRLAKERNHSATHLLAHALREVFGIQAVQLGSDNDENRLRFDFPLNKRPSEEEIEKVEELVNKSIKANYCRQYLETSFNEGLKLGAIALEGEDYGDQVRIVDLGVSKEFCGGTHIESTNLIEIFKIIRFESKGSGVFRIEAITSNAKVKAFEAKESSALIEELERLIAKNKILDVKYKRVIPIGIRQIKEAIEQAKEDNKKLFKQAQQVKVNTNIDFVTYNGYKTHINLAFNDANNLKNTAIALRDAFPDALIIIGTGDSRTTLAVASKVANCISIFDKIAKAHNGRGGGNSEFAMGSMDKVVKLNA